MNEFSLQGELSTTGTIFFVSPESHISKVTSMRFNNLAAYTLTLIKYNVVTATTYNIYSLTLNAGDTVTDDFVYFLEPYEYLIGISSIPGTVYVLNGVRYPIS